MTDLPPARALSDLHLSARTAPWVFAALDEVAMDAAARGGPTMVLGDVYESGDVVHMPTWNRLRDRLRTWPGDVVLLVGNHDQYGAEGRNALEAYNGLLTDGGSVRVVSDELLTDWGLFVAYGPPAAFWDRVAAGAALRDGDNAPIVWAHQGFRGTYRNEMSRDRDGVLPGRAPDWVRLIVAGHYHMPQNLAHVVYCGSPWQTSFAEEGQLKGWLAWDTLSRPRDFRRVQYGDLGAPLHRTVRWTPGGDPPPPPPDDGRRWVTRVKTDATRDAVKAAAAELRAAGLAGATVHATPEGASGRGVVRAGDAPVEAAYRWVDHELGGANVVSPAEVRELGESLWAG